MRLLEELERLGILTLPPRQRPGRGRQRPIQPDGRSIPQPAIEDLLASLVPLQLELVTAKPPVAEWNQWVERHHPLGACGKSRWSRGLRL